MDNSFYETNQDKRDDRQVNMGFMSTEGQPPCSTPCGSKIFDAGESHVWCGLSKKRHWETRVFKLLVFVHVLLNPGESVFLGGILMVNGLGMRSSDLEKDFLLEYCTASFNQFCSD